MVSVGADWWMRGDGGLPIHCKHSKHHNCTSNVFRVCSCLSSNNSYSADFPNIGEVTARQACPRRDPTFCVQYETRTCCYQIISSVQLVVCFLICSNISNETVSYEIISLMAFLALTLTAETECIWMLSPITSFTCRHPVH